MTWSLLMSMVSWKMEQTLNWSGDCCRKKYTTLISCIWIKLKKCRMYNLYTLERISTNPADEGRHAKAVKGPLTIIARTRCEWVTIAMRNLMHLINCGIGKVLSSPKATNPRVPINVFDRPKIRNKIAWERLIRPSVGSFKGPKNNLHKTG